jgi:hypothetical protein
MPYAHIVGQRRRASFAIHPARMVRLRRSLASRQMAEGGMYAAPEYTGRRPFANGLFATPPPSAERLPQALDRVAAGSRRLGFGTSRRSAVLLLSECEQHRPLEEAVGVFVSACDADGHRPVARRLRRLPPRALRAQAVDGEPKRLLRRR